MNETEMKKKISQLLRENKYLIDINEKLEESKGYGLIWRDYPEELDNPNIIPLLHEVRKLSVLTTKDKPLNYLIEGDNYHALKALERTHKEKVDIIYIDPPYNTGNEFVYNDKRFKTKDDSRHSRWLSFMYRRLEIAKKLMTDDGVIFVSIDDNEQAQLKLLMDKIFGEENFISNITWHNRNPNLSIISNDTEYILVYGKDITKITPVYRGGSVWLGEEIQREYMNKDNDERGLWRVHRHTKTKNRNPYEYAVNIKTKKVIQGKRARKYKNQKHYYYNNRWSFSPDTIVNLLEDNRVYIEEKNDKVTLFQVKKFKSEEIPYTAPKSIIFKSEAKTSDGKDELTLLGFNEKDFDYPKPVRLIKKLLRMINKKEAVVLDFFAGSGTTGHAVMELNEEDGGNRQFILCTNNEVSEEKEREYLASEGYIEKPHKRLYNKFKKEHPEQYEAFLRSEEYQQLGIARAVTRERLKRVIEGYTTPKGKGVKGLSNNLIYLQSSKTYFKYLMSISGNECFMKRDINEKNAARP